MSTASKIATILEMLSDGRWYGLEEIHQRAKIDEAQLQRIMDFLDEYGFTVRDEAGKKVKLNRLVQEFLAQTPTA
jgi:DNA-binding IclR family transcriptional regulator